MAQLDFTLDGRAVTIAAEPGSSLLEVLRETFGLRGPKDGCAPEGSCGACTVMVDGRAVVSCAQPAERVAGRSVTTQAGLSPEVRRQWADAFTLTGASQCGYCSPGVVMKAEALLGREPEPARDAIARSLAGNLCRCTGYQPIVDAIALVAESRRTGDAIPAADRSGMPGSRTARYQAEELTLGDKPFVADLRVPGMLHGALRFSDHPRAVVRRIDTTRAAAHLGVMAVVTAADVPGDRTQGLIRADWPVFVAEGETTRYVGDVLAAVAATTRRGAREAAALVEVEYEVLPPVTDPFEALADDAPAVHEGGNLLSLSVVHRGDVDAAVGGAAHVVTETFRTARIEHAFLEPEACLAVPADPDGPATVPRVHLYSQGQGAWDDRRQVASLLALEPGDVRVTQVAAGGAFGGKEDLSVQGQAALLARRTGRPVLLALSRRESLRFHPKRHPFWMDYTAACDADGRLVAVRARIVGDNGAYGSVGMKVLERAAGHACGPYRVPNIDIEARAVYTNNPPSGAMRGFGVNQTAFAIEGMLDRLAEQVGIDGWEIRWRNALREGDRFATGQRLGPGVGLEKTLLAVRDAYLAAPVAGIACGVKNTGIGNGVTEYGRAILRPESDGTITLYHSWTEMGQGCHTVFAQLAASTLGVHMDRIHVVVDTERELDTGQTTASRASALGGRAVIDAATKLRDELAGRPPEALAGREFQGDMVIDWTTSLEDDVQNPVTHFAFGWATQVVILDEDGAIARVIAAHDVGRVLNRTLVEGQVVGGVHMGLGQALSEEFVVRDGVPVTDTLKSLGIIPASGMPSVEPILVEEPQPGGPLGAKGLGEAVLVPTAAAVAAALYRIRWHPAEPTADARLRGRAGSRAAPRDPRRRHRVRHPDPGREAPMRTLLRGGTVVAALYPPEVTPADVLVEDGRIAAVGPEAARSLAGTEVIDCRGCHVIPGNVCGHTHAYSALARGMPYSLEPPRDFVEILRRVWWRLDRALDEESIRASATVAAMEALLAGTTTLVDHHASPLAIDGSLDIIAEAFERLGIRSILAYETTDRDGAGCAQAGLDENRRFLARVATTQPPLIRGLVGAHASFTLSDETLAGCTDLARASGRGLHIHVAEDAADQRVSEELHGVPVLERLERAGGLDPTPLLAHGVHLGRAEAALFRATGATLVHNARSNMNNAVGRTPLAILGPRVALGTDGIGADMFEESRVGHLRHLEERSATTGEDHGLLHDPGNAGATDATWPLARLAAGTRLVGEAFAEPSFGLISPGAPADLVVLDYPAPTPLTSETLAGHWTFGLSARAVRDVIVAGRTVVRERRLANVDQDALAAEARQAARRLWDRLDSIAEHRFVPGEVMVG